MTKWRRLLNAFILAQEQDRDCRRVLQFIGKIVAPVNYIGKASLFHDRQNQLNELMVFAGIRYTDDGTFVGVESALSVEDSLKKVSTLKRKLIELKVHAKILEHCTEELVSKDVFHAVLEACKGLFQTIREKNGLCYSIYSFNTSHEDTGIFGIYTALGKETEEKALQLIQRFLKVTDICANPYF